MWKGKHSRRNYRREASLKVWLLLKAQIERGYLDIAAVSKKTRNVFLFIIPVKLLVFPRYIGKSPLAANPPLKPCRPGRYRCVQRLGRLSLDTGKTDWRFICVVARASGGGAMGPWSASQSEESIGLVGWVVLATALYFGSKH